LHHHLKDEISRSFLARTEFKTQPENGFLRITIQDSGTGMTPSTLRQNFSSGDKISNDKINISTLGIYITKAIVNKLGGQLKVYSEFGKGTTIIVCLPASSL